MFTTRGAGTVVTEHAKGLSFKAPLLKLGV